MATNEGPHHPHAHSHQQRRRGRRTRTPEEEDRHQERVQRRIARLAAPRPKEQLIVVMRKVLEYEPAGQRSGEIPRPRAGYFPSRWVREAMQRQAQERAHSSLDAAAADAEART